MRTAPRLALLLLALVVAAPGCTDGGGGGAASSTGSPFRNLGKRGDSDLGAAPAGAARVPAP